MKTVRYFANAGAPMDAEIVADKANNSVSLRPWSGARMVSMFGMVVIMAATFVALSHVHLSGGLSILMYAALALVAAGFFLVTGAIGSHFRSVARRFRRELKLAVSAGLITKKTYTYVYRFDRVTQRFDWVLRVDET